MNALRRSLGLVGEHLGRIPVTARLLIGALMVILVLALALVAQLTGTSAMAPLGIKPEARAAAIQHLSASGVPHQDQDGEILVPAARQQEILAQLADREVISGDQIDFQTLFKESNPFLTREEAQKRYLVIKMNVLSGMISRFRGIERATVVIDDSARKGFGQSFVPPTAAVTVMPRGAELSQDQVEAIAHLVSGSHAGLDVAAVKVIDARNGTAHSARDAQSRGTEKYMEARLKAEAHARQKLLSLLGYIQGVIVEVNAMVDATQENSSITGYDEPKIGPLRESSELEESLGQQVTGEPGMQTNIGRELPRGTTVRKDKREASDVQSEPKFGNKQLNVVDSKGYPLKINASILVPRSYFVANYRIHNNDAQAQPDDAALAPLVASEIDNIKSSVEPLVDTRAFENAVLGTVVVQMFSDLGNVTAAIVPGAVGADTAGRATGAGTGALGGLVEGGLLERVGLAALALVALLMMLFMVRKASRTEELPSAAEVAGVPPTLPTDEDELVGEAGEADVALEGVELDDSTLRRQQMLDQIGTMIQQNPDEVAGLLRRWISMSEA